MGMGSISDSMSRMASGKRMGGISGAMERGPMKEREPETEHGGGVPEHLKALHAEMGGTHMHIHKGEHEEGSTTHHIKEDGKVEGPHEHQDDEELKGHIGRVFGGEEHESPSESEDHDDLM